jgi:ABC-type multidrug transport system ATPase subunit
MKINQLSYYDHKREWRLEPIQFSELNLLVGVSGVGKTRILKAILDLKKISEGESLNGIEWDIQFTHENNQYHWSGQFECNLSDTLIWEEREDKFSNNSNFHIKNESLSKNGELIIDRNESEIKFKNNTLPIKLSPIQSVAKILSEERDVSPILHGLNKIIFTNELSRYFEIFPYLMIPPDDVKILTNLISLNKNQEISILKKYYQSNMTLEIKLIIAYYEKNPVFQVIKERFINIFEQVEDIKIEQDEDENEEKIFDVSIKTQALLTIKIKERGVNHWISQKYISSGMYKTLMQISECYLAAEGSIILIDEFENSLGVNCIDILSDLLSENRNLQFIITSHHPYIINKVGMEHWKIVTRKGGVVIAKDAKDFGLGKSRHEAFMQLINLDEYNEGISA